ncbi:MAG: glycogen-debranching protein, partial [Planctomycetaceae bacterium]|nr:glycogen-debranching protein [Planctomycetaceae bacterium]
LYDQVSYTHRRNWANGHENQDGPAENFSSNCGHEGDEAVPPAVLKRRIRLAKNFCCLLFLANGTPMFLMGDEFLQTQGGNNNPYNQDNKTTWLDWSRLDRHTDFFRFFSLMIAFRKAHPTLCRSRFWRDDIHWYGAGKEVAMSWDSSHLAYCLRGNAVSDDDLYVMINNQSYDMVFTIQDRSDHIWMRAIDTALQSPMDILEPGTEQPVHSKTYLVKARSIVVLLRRSN